jgi:dephospho-CoA kinase
MIGTDRKLVLGIVGGIGAGKSTVAAEFESCGQNRCRVIAGDPIGHDALEFPEIKARIKDVWGNRGILREDGTIDRKKLGAIVFPSPVERSRLEHLVHPYIGRRIREAIDEARRDPDVNFVILDAAIMLEAGWDEVCDKIVYVDAPRSLRLQRVQAKRGWSEEDLANREAVQMPPDKKRERADAIVDNSGSPDLVRDQVLHLVRVWNLG